MADGHKYVQEWLGNTHTHNPHENDQTWVVDIDPQLMLSKSVPNQIQNHFHFWHLPVWQVHVVEPLMFGLSVWHLYASMSHGRVKPCQTPATSMAQSELFGNCP